MSGVALVSVSCDTEMINFTKVARVRIFASLCIILLKTNRDYLELHRSRESGLIVQ